MSKTNAHENQLLLLEFNATAIPNIADNAASAPLTDLQVSLHTADPGEAGDQESNEAAYTSYARVAVARTSGGWTVTGNSVSPVATISFPQATGGSEELMYFGIGTASSGAGQLLRKGIIGSQQGRFTSKADDTITIPGHSLSVNDRVAFFAGTAPTGLPTGMTEGTVYHVKTVSADDITISTTQGGATVDLTTVGDGLAAKVTPISISSGVTPELTTATTITED